MDFLGIEGFGDGYEFSKGAFDSMLKEIGASADADAYKELNKRIKTMYADTPCVPQAKLTQATYSLVREMMAVSEE